MSWETIVNVVFVALNSPVGVTMVASGALWLLNKLYAAKPLWQEYEGSIIRAVQWACVRNRLPQIA